MKTQHYWTGMRKAVTRHSPKPKWRVCLLERDEGTELYDMLPVVTRRSAKNFKENSFPTICDWCGPVFTGKSAARRAGRAVADALNKMEETT